MGANSRVRLSSAVTLALVVAVSGCSASDAPEQSALESTSVASIPASSSPASSSPASSSGSTFGEPSGLWDIPRDVQVAYFRAICMAPASKFGYAGTFDDSTQTCTTANDMLADVDFGMRGLLAKDAEQMRQSTEFMVTEAGVPVEDCPTPEDYDTVGDVIITNDCVIAAMKALTRALID